MKQRGGNERVAIFVPVVIVGREYILAFLHRVLNSHRDSPPELNIVMPCDRVKGGGGGFIRGAIKGINRSLSYAGAYSGWELVENAAIAVTDGVELIMTPGRLCQNGKPVPTRNADFQRFAQNMRKAGLAVLQAAHTKNQEKVSDATNDLADACSACHEVYRDKGPADSAARCTAPAK